MVTDRTKSPIEDGESFSVSILQHTTFDGEQSAEMQIRQTRPDERSMERISLDDKGSNSHKLSPFQSASHSITHPTSLEVHRNSTTPIW